jgi:hypothetical protein
MADKSEMVICEVFLGIFVVLLIAVIVRVWWVLGRRRRDVRKRKNPVKTLIVAGSGEFDVFFSSSQNLCNKLKLIIGK